MRDRALVRWLQVIAGSLGLLVLMAGITALFYLHAVRVDLSPGGRFTLSDHARSVLRELDRPVRITAFIRTEDPRNPILKDLLWQASTETAYVSYRVVDVNRNPSLAAQYGVDTYGATVVESDGKRADFTLPAESQLVAAILQVTRPPKKVYALSGHGECDLKSTDRFVGCSGVREALSSESYDLADIRLYGGREVPDDTDVLLIIGPKSDPVQAELDTLARFLDRGGKLAVFLDPYAAPKLAAFLVAYGIEVGANVIVDPEHRLAGGEAFSSVIPEVNRRHRITAPLDAPALFSAYCSIDAREDESIRRSATWLLRTGQRSWANYDPDVLAGAPVEFVAGRDRNGPLTVGVEVWMPAADAGLREAGVTTRIIAYGDSDFVSNRFLDYLGNRDLLVNTVNWLSREERFMAPRARRRAPGVNWLFISQAELRTLFIAAVMVQPGIFLAIGIVVLARRRLSP